MRSRYGNVFSTLSLTFTVSGVVLAIISVGLFLSFFMDSMVTDRTEEDFQLTGSGPHGDEYSVECDSKLPGAMMLSITNSDDNGWAWISIKEGGGRIQRSENVSFPFTQQYPLDGKGILNVTIIPQGGQEGFSDLDIGVSVSGPAGFAGAVAGLILAGPCCMSWIGSLAFGIAGIFIVFKERRDASRGGR